MFIIEASIYMSWAGLFSLFNEWKQLASKILTLGDALYVKFENIQHKTMASAEDKWQGNKCFWVIVAQ